MIESVKNFNNRMVLNRQPHICFYTKNGNDKKGFIVSYRNDKSYKLFKTKREAIQELKNVYHANGLTYLT